MSSKFKSFLSHLESKELKTTNLKMKQVVDRYFFHEITDQIANEVNKKITENLKESKVIIINHYEEQDIGENDLYFVVSFERTILLINQSRINILQNFLSKKEKLEIYSLSDKKDIFDMINSKGNETKIKYKEINNDENFKEEMNKINSNFFNKKHETFPYNDILPIIKSSISGYLLKKSYYPYDRMSSFNNEANNAIKPKEIKEEDIIELRFIGTGNSHVYLYYYIEYEKLVVIKKYNSIDPEIEKLLNREIRNYKEIRHPFIPKFYGTIKYDNKDYPVIEFINGKTLSDYNFDFNETEMYEIILQMLLVINYLHINHFIYRDLKPNNVIIDENKTLILIDFDQMIKDDEDPKTMDFQSSYYMAPEVKSNEFIL